MSTKITASEMYALANNGKCEGELQCHWCAAPCKRVFFHDDNLPLLIGGRREYAKRPTSPYICVGCCLYRRKRITVRFLDNSIKDGQCPINHSWLIKKTECFALKKELGKKTYSILLNPPLNFSLSIVDKGYDNPLQFQESNSFEVITSTSELSYTYNSKIFTYTINELELALRNGLDGISPGTSHLVRYFGEYNLEPIKKQEENKEIKRGRPFKEDERPSQVVDRIVRMKK